MENNAQFESFLWNAWETYLAETDDDDFEVNPGQMVNVLRLFALLDRMTKEWDGKLVLPEIVPRQRFVDVQAEIASLTFQGEKEVREFCDAIRCCSAVSIDPLGGTLSVGYTVPDVFRRKQNL